MKQNRKTVIDPRAYRQPIFEKDVDAVQCRKEKI